VTQSGIFLFFRQ